MWDSGQDEALMSTIVAVSGKKKDILGAPGAKTEKEQGGCCTRAFGAGRTGRHNQKASLLHSYPSYRDTLLPACVTTAPNSSDDSIQTTFCD